MGPDAIKKSRKILVTSALPYANGPIHLGHMVEHIQTDIWVRYLKFCGHEVYYFCADDTHGTPIMIAAKNRGITPEELVDATRKEHYRDLTAFDVEFDNYYTTNSAENRELSSLIYLKSREKGHIERRAIQQLYCDHDQIFLPDRYVRGKCPKCGAEGQYGDSCEVCGNTYNPSDLIDPKCSICGTKPVSRESDHLFFRLSDFQEFLKAWISSPGRVDEGTRKKMNEWLNGELRNWDISRDGPYFGFEIPDEKEKYFYVWLDAPIGYMASSMNYFFSRGLSATWDEFWKSESNEVHHFIGKDIVYFHTLFWPALLHAGDFRSPTAVHVHGFLTVNGEKMSKSRGTLIRAETYLKKLDPSALRFYYASKLSGGLDDLDLANEEFLARYNSDLVGNIVNLFSRLCAGIAVKLDHRLAANLSEEGLKLREEALSFTASILQAYENLNYARVIREIMAIGDSINRFISEREPWKSVKSDPEGTREIVTDALTAGRILIALLKPVLPVIAAGVEELLNLPEPVSLSNLEWTFPPHHTIHPYRHLASRIDKKEVMAMLEEEASNAMAQNKGEQEGRRQTMSDQTAEGSLIGIEDLSRVELRAGKIIKAETVEGADKLLRIELDLGEQRPRQVFAGIRGAYDPAELAGMTVVAVANLAPRKMKFGISEAMLLASGEGSNLTLFVPHRSAKPGDRLR
jgi:methionyl-tRNA synthetase